MKSLLRDFSLVAGLDAAYEPAAAGGADRCCAAAVLWDIRHGVVVEQALAKVPASFPYVPGLLALRELPGLLEALRLLSGEPDVLRRRPRRRAPAA